MGQGSDRNQIDTGPGDFEQIFVTHVSRRLDECPSIHQLDRCGHIRKTHIVQHDDINAGRKGFPIFQKANAVSNVAWTSMDPPLRETMLVRGDVAGTADMGKAPANAGNGSGRRVLCGNNVVTFMV